MTPEAAVEWQHNAEREFELWAKSKFCDSTRVNNFYEIQQTACIAWLMNGDACILIEYEKATKNFPYGLRVHLIESDRVSTPHSTGNNVYLYATNPDNGNRIFNGVEVDKNNRVIAYHICNTYPNSALCCHSTAASGVIPKNSASIVLFSFRPTPTTFVRFVLMADTASGADIYRLRDLCRNKGIFLSMSSCGVLLFASHPRKEFLLLEAPDSS